MPNTAVGQFITSIMESLNKNGFPDKKVALPLEKLYESAHDKGVNLNKVLEFLKEKGTFHTKTEDKIIFTAEDPDAPARPAGGFGDMFGGMDLSSLKNMNMGDMMKAASQMMQNMTPEQMQAIKNQIGNLSPEQIDSMKNMFGGLTEEQKKDLAEKAKDLKS